MAIKLLDVSEVTEDKSSKFEKKVEKTEKKVEKIPELVKKEKKVVKKEKKVEKIPELVKKEKKVEKVEKFPELIEKEFCRPETVVSMKDMKMLPPEKIIRCERRELGMTSSCVLCEGVNKILFVRCKNRWTNY